MFEVELVVMNWALWDGLVLRVWYVIVVGWMYVIWSNKSEQRAQFCKWTVFFFFLHGSEQWRQWTTCMFDFFFFLLLFFIFLFNFFFQLTKKTRKLHHWLMSKRILFVFFVKFCFVLNVVIGHCPTILSAKRSDFGNKICLAKRKRTCSELSKIERISKK